MKLTLFSCPFIYFLKVHFVFLDVKAEIVASLWSGSVMGMQIVVMNLMKATVTVKKVCCPFSSR